MNSYRKTCLLTFAGTLALAICVPAIAQQSADLAQQSADLVSPDQTGGAPQTNRCADSVRPSSYASPDADLTDKQWHYYGTVYLVPGNPWHGWHSRLRRQHPRHRGRDLFEFQGRIPGCVHTHLRPLLGAHRFYVDEAQGQQSDSLCARLFGAGRPSILSSPPKSTIC